MQRGASVRGRLWLTAKLILALAVVGAMIYWTKFSPMPVSAVTVSKTDIVAEVMGTGTLEARVTTSIGPKISGRIAEILVDQGDRVKTGEMLVRLEDEELTQQVEIARANLAARRAAIERLQADKQRTAAILTQSETNFQRQEKLAASQSVSVTELDKARESLAVAQAGLAHSEAATAEAQEELVAAQKSLEYQQTLLSNARISAPFDGLIVARNREPGDVVVPGSSILTLISTDELWINAWVDETEMAKLAPEQPARVIFRAEPNRAFNGKVARLGRQADRETREFIVDVTVLELPENWAVGQRADVFIEAARSSATLSVPTKAIVWQLETAGEPGSRTPGVFVIDQGLAKWQPTKLGLRSTTRVEITDGLTPEDTVIMPLNTTTSLSEGRRVSVQ